MVKKPASTKAWLRWGPVLVVIALLGLGGLAFGAAQNASDRYLSSYTSDKSNSGCVHPGTVYIVKIQGNQAVPSHINAHRCDVLAINNYDPVEREMAFGEHDAHTAYNGIYEELLGKNQGFKVTLNQVGNFRFHDHFDESVAGTFTVKF